MLYVCVQRFDVTRNLENFCKILGTKQALEHLQSETETAFPRGEMSGFVTGKVDDNLTRVLLTQEAPHPRQ
jgi:hypothetical protein